MSRLVGIYCAQGPYRYVRDLVDDGAEWFPWGYRRSSVADGVELRPGDLIELWEVDDTRSARAARPLIVAAVDFVSESSGYVACTLRTRPDACARVDEEAVVAAASNRALLAALPERQTVQPAE